MGAAAIGAGGGVAVMDMAGGSWAGSSPTSWSAAQQVPPTRCVQAVFAPTSLAAHQQCPSCFGSNPALMVSA